jgi:hypothetical protein
MDMAFAWEMLTASGLSLRAGVSAAWLLDPDDVECQAGFERPRCEPPPQLYPGLFFSIGYAF